MRQRAYPRWRGGNIPEALKPNLVKGLSPLARGKLPRAREQAVWTGPIPAGAGETAPPLPPAASSRAYPRWRGGNAWSW